MKALILSRDVILAFRFLFALDMAIAERLDKEK